MKEEELARLLDKLDLRQKVRVLTGATTWRTRAEPAVGLGPMTTSDGPAGVRGEAWDERDTSVLIPSASALGAMWDEGLVERLGRPARGRGPPQGRGRGARAHAQPAPLAPGRPALRVLLRGPGTHRPHRSRTDPGHPGARRLPRGQALRGERLGDRTADRRRPCRRTCPAGGLPRPLRGRGGGGRPARHGRVQRGQRRHDDGEPAPERAAEGGVGLRRRRCLRLGRGAVHRGVRPVRSGPGHAGAREHVGGRPGRGGACGHGPGGSRGRQGPARCCGSAARVGALGAPVPPPAPSPPHPGGVRRLLRVRTPRARSCSATTACCRWTPTPCARSR